jgi:NADH:ubiquinone oxidoreductase subunit 4 (subunit M)
MLVTTGIIALAVPGSSAFAGEFLILNGILPVGWGWAVAGATGIVLAAMYMLRLISAVLHQDRGPAVSDAALDLRPAELGILVPLVGCLLALSAWPAAISGNATRGEPSALATVDRSYLVTPPGASVIEAFGPAPKRCEKEFYAAVRSALQRGQNDILVVCPEVSK